MTIDVVIDGGAACVDRDRARAALEEVVSTSRAPRRSASRGHDEFADRWKLRAMFSSRPDGIAVEATIVDDAGTTRGGRTLSQRGTTCLPLAHAVGAWATLVFDAELAWMTDEDPSMRSSSIEGGSNTRRSTFSRDLNPGERDEAAASVVGSPTATDVGLASYVRSGTGGVAGATPFVAVEVAPSWVVRTSAGYGRARAIGHAFGRVDGCKRIPGNYVERRGLELDLCVGADVGYVFANASEVRSGQREDSLRLTVGPSAVLRGEVAGPVALEVRALSGVNLVREPVLAEAREAWLMMSAELGVSVRLP